MCKVQNVARYLVETVGSMTTMKLEKLAYYCQAWSLVWDGEPLFEEDFQAWANGPVCPELFKEHRGIYRVDEDFLEEYSEYPFTEDQIDTMNAVIEGYAEKSPHYLSELTHKERPWKSTRGNIALGEYCDKVISKEEIQDYYTGISNYDEEE